MPNRCSSVSSSSSLSTLSLKIRRDLLNLSCRDPVAQRTAMESLKALLQSDLHTWTIPCFLETLSNVENAQASAILLFSDLARVHTRAAGHFVPRMMSIILRCLSSSSSVRTGLHRVCADVVSSFARYCIGTSPCLISSNDSILPSLSSLEGISGHDSMLSSLSALDGISSGDSILSLSPPHDGISSDHSTLSLSSSHGHDASLLRELAQPLLKLLSSSLEHISMGSATCLTSLIQSENWSKHANSDLVRDVCYRASMCLVEKKKLTTTHFGLVQSLGELHASYLDAYRASLLWVCAGAIVVNPPGGMRLTSGSGRPQALLAWQVRVAAARLIRLLIGGLENRTSASELGLVIRALDKVRVDPAPKVRQAATEILSLVKEWKEEDILMGSRKRTTRLLGKNVGRSSSESGTSSVGDVEDLKVGDSLDRGPRRGACLGLRVTKSSENSASDGCGIRDLRVKEYSERISRRNSPGSVGECSSESSALSGRGIQGVHIEGSSKQIWRRGQSFRRVGESLESSGISGAGVVDSPEYLVTVVTDFTSPCSSVGSSPKLGRTSPLDHMKQLSLPPDLTQCGVDSEWNHLLPHIELPDFKEFAPLSCELMKSNELGNMHINIGTELSSWDEADRLQGNDQEADQCEDNRTVEECRQNGDNSDGPIGSLFVRKPEDEGAGQVLRCENKGFIEENKAPTILASKNIVELIDGAIVATGADDDGEDEKAIKTLLISGDYLTFSTPGRLVKSLHLVRSGLDLRGPPFEYMVPDFDFKTLSESCWSVRENPIANDTNNNDMSSEPYIYTLLYKKDIRAENTDSQTKISSLDISSVTCCYEDYVDTTLVPTGLSAEDPMPSEIQDNDDDIPRHERTSDQKDGGHIHGHRNNVSFSSLKLHQANVSLVLQGMRLKYLQSWVGVPLLGALLTALIFTTLIAMLNNLSCQDESHALVPT